MGFQKIEKKQMPQVIGLGIASCSMFGYFAYKMIAPTASAAAAPTAKKASLVSTPATPQTAAAGASGPGPDAPPPSPGMRDPFVPAISDQMPVAPQPVAAAPAQPRMASRGEPTPDALRIPSAQPLPGGAPALPPAGGVASDGRSPQGRPGGPLAPMPIGPAPITAPAWTVTGVLRSGLENIAVLRSGDERRIVRAGEMVDGQFRIVDVTRQYVVLRHGAQIFTLPLGGAKVAPAIKLRRTPQGTEFSGIPTLNAPVNAPTPASRPDTANAATPAGEASALRQAQEQTEENRQKLQTAVQTPDEVQTVADVPHGYLSTTDGKH